MPYKVTSQEEAMHITITGNLGSGKSTISEVIRDKFGFEIYSTGTIQRKLAKDLGKTTLEMNELMRNNPKYDNMIDDSTTKTAKENIDKNIVFDSRLAWHFVERSFKVFVTVSLDLAAERIYNADNRGLVEQYLSEEDAKAKLTARANTENIRYKEIYGLEYFDFKNYNLVIDSTYNDPDEIANVIIGETKKFYSLVEELGFEETNKGWNSVLLSPKQLLHEEISVEDSERLRGLVAELKDKGNSICKKILVKKVNGKHHIIEGKDEVMASYLAGLPFVETILTA